jgi:alpha-N-arabinofuranosidase
MGKERIKKKVIMYLKDQFVTLISKALVQIVNFGSHAVRVRISTTGLGTSVNAVGSTVTVLTSGNVMDENSFSHPQKVVPVKRQLRDAAEQMRVKLAPHSLTSFDLALAQSKLVTLVEKDEEYLISRV